MDDPEQALAYGRADFEEPHSNFIKLLEGYCSPPGRIGRVLDMGCGTGDITFRIGRAFSGLVIDAIDGSAAMLFYANEGLIRKPEFEGRIHFLHGKIQEFTPDKSYGLIVSNSLLHHIPRPG
jgi:trans-aconitate methyltransferase